MNLTATIPRHLTRIGPVPTPCRKRNRKQLRQYRNRREQELKATRILSVTPAEQDGMQTIVTTYRDHQGKIKNSMDLCYGVATGDMAALIK